MNTIVKDWHIVSIYNGKEYVGKILWGICVDDMTCRFSKGDYISTSKIVAISPHNQLIETKSGSIYQVIGEGQKAQLQMKDFELLRHGFSPNRISQFNLQQNGLIH